MLPLLNKQGTERLLVSYGMKSLELRSTFPYRDSLRGGYSPVHALNSNSELTSLSSIETAIAPLPMVEALS